MQLHCIPNSKTNICPNGSELSIGNPSRSAPVIFFVFSVWNYCIVSDNFLFKYNIHTNSKNKSLLLLLTCYRDVFRRNEGKELRSFQSTSLKQPCPSYLFCCTGAEVKRWPHPPTLPEWFRFFSRLLLLLDTCWALSENTQSYGIPREVLWSRCRAWLRRLFSKPPFFREIKWNWTELTRRTLWIRMITDTEIAMTFIFPVWTIRGK